MARETYKIDAEGKALGRLASDIAAHLIGKHKPNFQSHIDDGDNVEVANIAKVRLTGKKVEQKVYHRHTGYPGGVRTTTLANLMEENPAKVLEAAVSRMLPKNKHRTNRMKRLIIS